MKSFLANSAMMAPKRYKFRIPDEIAALVRNLHPEIKAVVRLALQTILDEPHCGKALKDELSGLRSYRVKKYRVIYRVSVVNKELEIVAIGPRKNIYEQTFRIISKTVKS